MRYILDTNIVAYAKTNQPGVVYALIAFESRSAGLHQDRSKSPCHLPLPAYVPESPDSYANRSSAVTVATMSCE